MSKKEDNALQIYFTEESDLDLVEENKRYTIRGVTLDTKSKVTRELTNIRIHMIDFGFDEATERCMGVDRIRVNKLMKKIKNLKIKLISLITKYGEALKIVL